MPEGDTYCGGNVALRELAEVDATHRRHVVFSILRVFGPTATTAEVDAAEAHCTRALLTRQYGLDRNWLATGSDRDTACCHAPRPCAPRRLIRPAGRDVLRWPP